LNVLILFLIDAKPRSELAVVSGRGR